jgi:hypothetical protein
VNPIDMLLVRGIPKFVIAHPIAKEKLNLIKDELKSARIAEKYTNTVQANVT